MAKKTQVCVVQAMDGSGLSIGKKEEKYMAKSETVLIMSNGFHKKLWGIVCIDFQY